MAHSSPRLPDGSPAWVLWGSELSPFALKVEALLRACRVPFAWQPAHGPLLHALRSELRRRRLVAGHLRLTWPQMSPLDEFPQVPFLFGPKGENLYDSSAIAAWLADGRMTTDPMPSLLPRHDPGLHFAIRLIDEALDEVGLYLVHHNRWVVAARDNNAGERLASEFRTLLGPLAGNLARSFPARQVRRLPYLFSVAEEGVPTWDDLPKALRPPSRPSFPPTHALLQQAFRELLAAIEPLLAKRPYLFGNRFTVADASLYGQLGMNRKDPSAWAWIQRDAPTTAAWIERIANGDFERSGDPAQLGMDAALLPLLQWVADFFVPLMQQNHAAWQRHRDADETLFNEAAFNAGRALYDGSLCGQPFRSVAKTFQVRVWNDLQDEWERLGTSERESFGVLQDRLRAAP